MKSGAFQNLEKERRANQPGAKSGINNGAASPRSNQWPTSTTASLGKNMGTVSGQQGGTYSGLNGGSLSGKNTGNIFGLSKLGRHDLIRFCQAILLRFPVKEIAEDQDATTKAVESQRNGDCAMSLLAAANWCRGNPRARALFAPLFGFTGRCTDPDFMQGWELLAQSYMREQLANFAGLDASEVQAMDDPEDAGEERDLLTGDLFEPRGSA